MKNESGQEMKKKPVRIQFLGSYFLAYAINFEGLSPDPVAAMAGSNLRRFVRILDEKGYEVYNTNSFPSAAPEVNT